MRLPEITSPVIKKVKQIFMEPDADYSQNLIDIFFVLKLTPLKICENFPITFLVILLDR